jgi:hypothetical protein
LEAGGFTELSIIRVDFPPECFDRLLADYAIEAQAKLRVSHKIELFTNLKEGLCAMDTMRDWFVETKN